MSSPDQDAAEWIDAHVTRLRPLEIAANRTGWEAATTGSEEAINRSAEARVAMRLLYANAEQATRVRELLAAGVEDPLLRRQLVLLDLTFQGYQLPPETIDDLARREAALEEIFYNFRAKLEGEELSNNQLLDVLRTERDSERRRAAWEASKRIGEAVAPELLELVRKRNDGARTLGFANFYSMELARQEIDEDVLFTLLDELRRSTDEPFQELRREMDSELSRRFGVADSELYPWHWEDFFSQSAPAGDGVDLDALFRGRDLVELAERYFEEIDLPIGDVLDRSDLFEREGKDQHAFCTDIDREGDVRILCNLQDNERWMSTLLHELGHAAYDKFVPRSLPYLLRAPAHTLTTEAVAMFMGRLTRTPGWLTSHLGVELDGESRRAVTEQLRRTMLISARWIMVMAYFERELYRNPERADLGRLWWELVESLQGVQPPSDREAPDWATKIHLSLAPVYYHNYLLGELMTSQLGAAVGDGASDGGVGRFLRQRVFDRGAVLPWNKLLTEATGEPLTPRHFLRDFATPPAR